MEKLKQDFRKTPLDFGYSQGFWTLKLLKQHIRKHTGETYSESRLSELMHHWGFSLKKPRHKSAKANKESQRKFLEEDFPALVAKAQEKAKAEGLKIEYWFPDEAGIRRIGTLRAAWYPTGSACPEILETDGRFESVKLMGMVNPHTGHFHLKNVVGKITTQVYADWLISICRRSPDTLFVITHDNAPWHGVKKLPKLLEDAGITNILIQRLPAYSPTFNPCEKLWKWLREYVTHNHAYANLDLLLDNIWRFYRYAYRDRSRAIRRFKTEEDLFANCRIGEKG